METKNPPNWKLIFVLSTVNGAVYDGANLPVQKWDWPKGWLQSRLEQVRKEQADDGR